MFKEFTLQNIWKSDMPVENGRRFKFKSAVWGPTLVEGLRPNWTIKGGYKWASIRVGRLRWGVQFFSFCSPRSWIWISFGTATRPRFSILDFSAPRPWSLIFFTTASRRRKKYTPPPGSGVEDREPVANTTSL
jgi:hypothetical protein